MSTEAEQEQKLVELLEDVENGRNEIRSEGIENRGGKKKLTRAKVEIHPEKGMLSHMKEYKYPMKGVLDFKRINAAGAIKRALLWGLKLSYKGYVRKQRVDVAKLTPFLKEVYRVCNIAIQRERDDHMKEKWLMIRDTLTLMLEDHAYTFRIQDLAKEVDISKLLPDKTDEYYMSQLWHSKHYNWGGKISQEEWDKRSEEKRKQYA